MAWYYIQIMHRDSCHLTAVTDKAKLVMKRYGWFQFDNAPRRITNYLPGQELLVTSVIERQEVRIHSARYSE